MRDNMLKTPGIPSNSDEGDLYEKIETRPGTTEKQKEAGRCAYTELLESHARWAGGTYWVVISQKTSEKKEEQPS